MQKKYLVSIPTGLNSPELELLVSYTQELIDKKNDVTILTCGGGKNYSCAKNLFFNPVICILCKKKRNKMFANIKGDYNLIETPENKNPIKFKEFKNFKKLKQYYYKGLDNGLAAYSSYLDVARDKDLQGFFSKKIISQLIFTTNYVSDFYIKFLKANKFNELICFNSRMNLYRPLFRIASKFKLKLNNLETTHDGKRSIVHNFKKSLANDYDLLPEIINQHWKKKNKLNKTKLVNKFYSGVREYTSRMENSSAFLLLQKDKLLPDNWNKSKFNIVYFASSEDEYESIVKKNDDTIFSSQIESILAISKIIAKKKEFFLYVRMHPNLENVKWRYVTDILNLENNYDNLCVIKPDSPISTHEIMKEADLVFGLRSRTLLESTFIKKPTIIMGRSYWDVLGPFLKITSRKQLKKLILSKKVKILGDLAAKKYAYFWLTSGGPHKYLTGNYLWSKDKRIVKPNFKFKNYSVKFTIIEQFIYYSCKVLERILLYLNFKLSK